MGSIDPYESRSDRRYRTPERRQTDKRGFHAKREAEDFLATVEVSKLRREFIDPTRSRITVADWAPRWYDSQLQLEETTLSGYRRSLEKHVLPKWTRSLSASPR